MAKTTPKLETTVAQPASAGEADSRVNELAEKIYIRLVTSRMAEGRTSGHYRNVAVEHAKAFYESETASV